MLRINLNMLQLAFYQSIFKIRLNLYDANFTSRRVNFAVAEFISSCDPSPQYNHDAFLAVGYGKVYLLAFPTAILVSVSTSLCCLAAKLLSHTNNATRLSYLVLPSNPCRNQRITPPYCTLHAHCILSFAERGGATKTPRKIL